jgi:holo-[acyl-carrier protein] synthase
MIAGLGIDMIEVDRIAEKINKESGFRELLFSPNEITYCESKTNKFEYYAARFAAKEAFYKALGTGWLEGTAFNEIEIVHTATGKPEFNFTGATATVIDLLEFSTISISLTHLKATASAVVIIEKK